jgi:hypothetical protein
MSEKYCTMPGQEPIRIASTSGHTCIIGEIPREIPERFVRDAVAKGCFTETQIKGIVAKLTSGEEKTLAPGEGAKITDVPDPLAAERHGQIKEACIQILNAGDPEQIAANGGKPKLDAIESLVGFKVSGPERDAAFEEVKG